jgi:hypothetical protein
VIVVVAIVVRSRAVQKTTARGLLRRGHRGSAVVPPFKGGLLLRNPVGRVRGEENKCQALNDCAWKGAAEAV